MRVAWPPRSSGSPSAHQEPAIDTALGLLAVAALIAANATFVAAEFALVAVDRARLEQQARDGDRRAGLVRRLVRRLSFHLSGAQLGITVTSLVVGFLTGPVIAPLIEPLVAPVLGEASATGVAVTLALVLATVVQMVLGELVPKTVAISRPERTARRLGPVISAYGTVFGPVIRFLNSAADRTVRLVGIEPREELSTVRSLSELQLLFEASTDEGVLARSAGELLERSIRLADKTAADALVPRMDVRSVGLEATVDELVALSRSTGHSRFPVLGADLDDVRGVVHVQAALALPRDERPATRVGDLMVDARVVPETRDLDDLLVDLRDSGAHLAVVVDEYGGTAGIITLEDVLEEIVGDISDEYDAGLTGMARRVGPGQWVLSGLLHRDEVADVCGLEVPDGDYETLAGFVLDRLGHVPAVGERVGCEGWQLEVEAMERHRVAYVRCRAPHPGQGAPSGAEPGAAGVDGGADGSGSR